MRQTILFLVSLLATGAFAGAPLCTSNKALCIQSAPTIGDASSVDILVSTNINGWVSFGFGGSGMFGADMAMIWQENNAWKVSRRLSTAHRLPAAGMQLYTIVNATTAADPATGMHFIYLRRPIAKSSSTAADLDVPFENVAVAFAYYKGSSVSASSLPFHSFRQNAAYSFLDASSPLILPASLQAPPTTPTTTASAGVAAPPPSAATLSPSPLPSPVEEPQPTTWISRDLALQLHVWSMSIAWSFLSFAAVFTARFLKHRLPTTWFNFHRVLFTLVLVLTALGMTMILTTADAGTPMFSSVHGKLGLAVALATPLQVVLGIVIDKLFDPARVKVPARDKLHWFAGYFVAIAGPINAILGLNLFAGGLDFIWLAINLMVIGGWIGAFVVAQLVIGQKHEASSTPTDKVLEEDHTRPVAMGREASELTLATP
ncbi:hypothetical protein BC828DRAFT_232744 [Blastocladiella britannica]|nr:hypothetical protein BC828DRAFT_232744 [Blastocladiella britannica]